MDQSTPGDVRGSRNTQDTLMDTVVRLVANQGVGAATTRAIAEGAGVTEGAIYRHYQSKQELHLHAYKRIVEEMIREKEHLATSPVPICEKLHEWVQLTYAYFDRHPEAFTYVLLIPLPVPEPDEQITTRQGRLFMELIMQGISSGQIRPLLPEMALSHFTGVMLNVPRLIRAGTLHGPASQYGDQVVDAAWRIIGLGESKV